MAPLNNRATRVAKMINRNNNKNKTKKLVRQNAFRYLIEKPKKRLSFSNKQNVFGTNFVNLTSKNYPYMKNLIESRESINVNQPFEQNISLNAKEAKMFANISALHNDYTNAINAIWEQDYKSLPNGFKNLPQKSKNKLYKKLHYMLH